MGRGLSTIASGELRVWEGAMRIMRFVGTVQESGAKRGESLPLGVVEGVETPAGIFGGR